jgi:V/A-type H+-transporting ATPase subunit D
LALKFQYNKTFLQQLNKDLKIRINALPTLQAKESALRMEVKKAKQYAQSLEKELKQQRESLEPVNRLWCEFPEDLLSIADVLITIKKIAGVKTPTLNTVEFQEEPFSLFSLPSWVQEGLEILKSVISLEIKKELAFDKLRVLEYARKKTTQKVNLYEKVQIPEYQEAILKIKRFLEDDENLAKSSQKILKARLAQAEAA